MRNAARTGRLRRLATAAAVSASVFAVAACGDDSTHDRTTRLAVQRLDMRVAPALVASPPVAARLALAADQLLPSSETEMSMLRVAAHETGVDRVIAAHTSAVTAVVRMDDKAVTAGRDRALRVWSTASGARLMDRRVSSPIVRMAGSTGLPGVVVTADEDGAVALWDVSSETDLDQRPLQGRLREGPPLAVAIANGGETAFAVTADGHVDRWDVASGARLRTLDLARARGGLPWRRGDRLQLKAAALNDDTTGPTLDVATASAVARIDLKALRGRTLVPSQPIDATINSVATAAFGDPSVAIGTNAGFFLWNHASHLLTPEGGGASHVAFSGDRYLVASSDGVRSLGTDGDDRDDSRLPSGPPAVLASDGPGGAAIGRDDGTVTLPGVPGTGLELAPGNSTSVARFGPDGLVLTTEGFDANHIEDLATVRVGRSAADDAAALPKARTYKPDRRWWPRNANGSDHWYVSDATSDHELMAAAGQDPTGTASVLVWNARTGRPLRRLALTTGGVQPNRPSIATQVELLPKQNLLAAYSAVQESVVLWSTSTWARVATIDVGPAGELAATADQKTLIVAGLSDDQSGVPAGHRTSRLAFIDVGRRAVDHVVGTEDTARVSPAPDGHAIATIDGGRVRILAPDGRHDLVAPVHLGADLGTELAWRPDGELLAVGRSEGGVAMIDPDDGRLVATVPTQGTDIPMSLSWSPDGRLLAATNGVADSDGSGFTSVLPTYWRLDRGMLRTRMCRLVGRRMTAAEWHHDTGLKRAMPQSPCVPRSARAAKPEAPAALPEAPVLAFVRHDRVLVAGADGRPVPIAALPQGEGSYVTFAWSPEGALGWTADGRLMVFDHGKLRAWLCACSGMAFDGEVPTAVSGDAGALLAFRPGAAAGRRTVLRGLALNGARLVARRGDNALVVGFADGIEGEDRATTLAAVHGGRVRLRRQLKGSVSSAPVAAPDGLQVAFRTSATSTPCYPNDAVALVDIAGGRITYPALPDDVHDPHAIRSLSWPQDGALTALVSRPPCSAERELDWAPAGQLLRLDSDRFARLPERDFDISVGRGRTARITAPVRTASLKGRLTLAVDGHPAVNVASDVVAMSVRP
jgi:WD40 repeat protein